MYTYYRWGSVALTYNQFDRREEDICSLTHSGRATQIRVSKLTIIASDNGLSHGRRQAIIWNSAGILSIGLLGTTFSEILIEILTFSFKKMCLKVSSVKWRPFCLSLNVLNKKYTSTFRRGQWVNTCMARWMIHFQSPAWLIEYLPKSSWLARYMHHLVLSNLPRHLLKVVCSQSNATQQTLLTGAIWARFLSLARSKLRLCSANHRACYFSNLACDWLSRVRAYCEKKTESGPRTHAYGTVTNFAEYNQISI